MSEESKRAARHRGGMEGFLVKCSEAERETMRRGEGEERLEAPVGWLSGLTRVDGQAGRTALVIAAQRHKWDAVLQLASAGANINAADKVTSWGMRAKPTVVGVGVGGQREKKKESRVPRGLRARRQGSCATACDLITNYVRRGRRARWRRRGDGGLSEVGVALQRRRN